MTSGILKLIIFNLWLTSIAFSQIPVITLDPVSDTLFAGETLNLTVTATPPGVTYKWQSSQFKNDSWIDVTGATSDTYNLASAAQSDSGWYRMIVSNANGDDTSAIADMVILPSTPLTIADTFYLAEGQSITINSASSADWYQWQRDTTFHGLWMNLAGETDSSLVLSSVTFSDSGLYRYVGKLGVTTIRSSPIWIVVLPPAANVLNHPMDTTVAEGTNLDLTVTATGTLISYQWQRTTTGVWQDVSGATTPTLSFSPIQFSDSADYRVIVSNLGGKDTSNVATVDVYQLPQFTSNPGFLAANEGGTVKFGVTALGSNLSYQWQTDTSGSWVDILGGVSDSLSLGNITLDHGGNYRVIIGNFFGTDTSQNGVLTVNPLGPAFNSHPQSVNANRGDTVKFDVQAIGGGLLQYQWQFKASGGSWIDASSTTSSLSLPDVNETNEGEYRVIVSDTLETDTSQVATLTVFSTSPTYSGDDSLVIFNQPIKLGWDPDPNSNTIYIEVSQDSGFGTIVFTDTLLADSVTLDSLAQDGMYYWRIRTDYPEGPGDWSDVRKFDIQSLPGTVTLITPKGQIVQGTSSINFLWSTSSGASEYRIQIADTNNQVSILLDTTVNDTSFIISGFPFERSFFWQIRGINPRGDGAWSEPSTFELIPPVPGTPTLLSPSNNSGDNNQTQTFTWDTVPDAHFYELQLAHDTSFTTFLSYDSIFALNHQMDLPSSQRIYYWRVRSKTNLTSGLYSETWMINIGNATPVENIVGSIPEKLTLLSEKKGLLKIGIPESGTFKLELINPANGKRYSILNTFINAGWHQFESSNLPSANGIYLYHISKGNLFKSGKITWVD